jgi:hypothetical protein
VPRKADAAERKWLAFFARHEISNPSASRPTTGIRPSCAVLVPWLIESQLIDNELSPFRWLRGSRVLLLLANLET